jgi:hypothetical protein
VQFNPRLLSTWTSPVSDEEIAALVRPQWLAA